MNGIRVFGDFPASQQAIHRGRCTCCRTDDKDVYRFNTRQYICLDCIELKKDEVLPMVKRREAFAAKVAALRARAEEMGTKD